MRTLEDTAVAFDAACRASGVGYAVVGGFAVSTWGQPRTTSGVDALVDLNEPQIIAFAAALASAGLTCSARDLHDALREGGHATIFDDATSFHVDAKLVRSPQERDQIAAAVDVPFHGAQLRVARAEDTVAYKLKFGTDQDVRDALSILVRRRGRLDESRLEALALHLGVADALGQLRKRIL